MKYMYEVAMKNLKKQTGGGYTKGYKVAFFT